jgi:small-conductance mechanosensitive channel
MSLFLSLLLLLLLPAGGLGAKPFPGALAFAVSPAPVAAQTPAPAPAPALAPALAPAPAQTSAQGPFSEATGLEVLLTPTDDADRAPLLFRGDTLGFVYGALPPFTVEERADAISERLTALHEAGVPPADVRVLELGDRLAVWVGGSPVLAITDEDARAAGTAEDAAMQLADAVRTALSAPLPPGSLRGLAIGFIFTALATLALYTLLRLGARWYPRVYRRIRDIQEDKLPSIRIQNLEIVSGEKIEAGLLLLARISRWALTSLLLVLYFPLVFSFFPATRSLAERLLILAWEPFTAALLAVFAYFPNLFYIAVIMVLTHYGLRLVRVVFTALSEGNLRFPGFYSDWAMPTFSLIRVLGIAFAVILIWPYLPNSDSLAFKGVAGFLGLLLTFGSAGAVSNVVGGIVMIYMRPFQIGDRVKIADTVGDVVERGILVTRLRTPKKVEVTIPNAMILGTYIVNYSSTAREGGVILHTTVTLGYDLDWRKVHAVMTDAAMRTEGILAEPHPFVLQTALGDYSVSYELNAYTDSPHTMARIYSALHQNLQDALAEAGIEILSPVYHALRDGNPSTIPAPHTPPDSETPSFRVQGMPR